MEVDGEGCAWEKEERYYLRRCHIEEGDLEHPAKVKIKV